MAKILQFLRDNRLPPKAIEVSASADEATIYLYDVIVSDAATAEWFGGVAAEPFVKALNALTAPTIHLRINCPGGDVFAGRAIEQAIRAHASKIVAHVDGYAASAASFVAIAADEVEIAAGAFFMVHKSWTFAYGNADDLVDTADLLDKVDGTIVDSYALKTKADKDAIRQWMADETWFTGQEAVDAGFADRLAEDAPKAERRWNLSAYKHAPKQGPQPEPAAAEHEHRARRLAALLRKPTA